MPPKNRSNAGRTVLLVVIAIILGIFIVRQIPDSNKDTAGTGGNTATTAKKSTGKTTTTSVHDTTTLPTTTTTINLNDAKVLVLNASGIAGSAGKWATALSTNGIPTITPGNAKKVFDTSAIYYLPGFDRLASAIQAKVPSLPYGGPVPTGDLAPADTYGGANIVVVLGKDLAASVPFGSPITVPPSSTRPPLPTTRPATTVRKTTTTVKK
jgi:hypothetical protein